VATRYDKLAANYLAFVQLDGHSARGNLAVPAGCQQLLEIVAVERRGPASVRVPLVSALPVFIERIVKPFGK
jgi:hypothetical protein